MKEKIIEVKNLTLTIGRQKLLDIDSFALYRGETMALIGPNGAGKSSLLQVLMLLKRPSSGDLYFKGEIIDQKKVISFRRRMAMVFQEALLLDTTVRQNVAAGLKIRGVDKEVIEDRVNSWLKKMGIFHLADRQARNLSGGESQRVSLARALAIEPEVLFMDEPFSALDAPTRNSLITELAAILRETGLSSVFVTHNYSEVPLLTGRVAVMEKGQIIQTGSPREILTKPVNKTAALLVGVENIIPGRITGREKGKVFVKVTGICTEKVELNNEDNFSLSSRIVTVSDTALPDSKLVYILLRPEDIKIVDEIKNLNNKENVFSGRIIELLPQGGMFKAVVDCSFPVTTLLYPDFVLSGEMSVGKKVYIVFNPEKVHLIEQE